MIRIGIDLGSTTAKIVAVSENGNILYSDYKRHFAKPREVLRDFMLEMVRRFRNTETAICFTGSVGMGVAERCSLPFVQEVVAATKAANLLCPEVSTMIDIGGEDTKIVFMDGGHATDLRMNSNCAGGTGAFLDQMALLLGVETSNLDSLAAEAMRIYPMASRCGVFKISTSSRSLSFLYHFFMFLTSRVKWWVPGRFQQWANGAVSVNSKISINPPPGQIKNPNLTPIPSGKLYSFFISEIRSGVRPPSEINETPKTSRYHRTAFSKFLTVIPTWLNPLIFIFPPI